MSRIDWYKSDKTKIDNLPHTLLPIIVIIESQRSRICHTHYRNSIVI
jgi:hypothetical protein